SFIALSIFSRRRSERKGFIASSSARSSLFTPLRFKRPMTRLMSPGSSSGSGSPRSASPPMTDFASSPMRESAAGSLSMAFSLSPKSSKAGHLLLFHGFVYLLRNSPALLGGKHLAQDAVYGLAVALGHGLGHRRGVEHSAEGAAVFGI